MNAVIVCSSISVKSPYNHIEINGNVHPSVEVGTPVLDGLARDRVTTGRDGADESTTSLSARKV